MDLSRRGHITPDEHLALVQELQFVLLDELSRAARWGVGDAVFHGGTSLESAWRSPRWSEDLDFLVSGAQRGRLVTVGPKVAAATRTRLTLAHPGCAIEFKAKSGEPDADDCIDVWTVKWTHPNRIGKVMVKVEFYRAADSVLADYKAQLARPEKGGASVSVVMPVAELVSLWADKVKVLATRPAHKHRDSHDLAFVAESLDRRGWPDADALRVALAGSASIYRKTLSDVGSGLADLLGSGVLDDVAAFEADMSKWYPSALFRDLSDRGMFRQMLTRAKSETARGAGICSDAALESDAAGPGARP